MGGAGVLGTGVVERPRYVLGGQRTYIDEFAVNRAVEVNALADEHSHYALVVHVGQVGVVKALARVVPQRLSVQLDGAAGLGGKFPFPACGDEGARGRLRK